MHTHHDDLEAEVEEALFCLFTEVTPTLQAAELAASGTRIEIDAQAGLFRSRTRVEGAHNGLDRTLLLDLLTRNFPNDLTRAAFLANGPAAGHLTLVTNLPLRGLAGGVAAQAVLDQVAAALALGEEIGARLAKAAA